MKLQGNDVSNVEKWEDLRRYTASNFKNTLNVINGNLEFGGNFKGTEPIPFQITAANQVIQVNFNLPYTPSNFLVTFQDAGAVIWVPSLSQYPWDKLKAYLTANAAVTGKVIFF